jgi:4-diphosphocytidyl-2-C-methyl-D-erythritol kinase
VSSSDEAPSDESNICFKAARLLQQHFTIDDGVRISIIKNIPVGAGLGGGSSDAATILRHLPRFWNRRVDEQALEALALQLGSDVPFFLGKSSALGTQRGEKLEWFELDVPYFILLCNPNIHISTAWAYQNVLPDNSHRHDSFKQVLLERMNSPLRLARGLRNDFEPIVFMEYPEVLRVKETMLRAGAHYASMSGSGSSVYGFFERDDTAAAVAQLFRAKGYRTFLTRPHFSPNP